MFSAHNRIAQEAKIERTYYRGKDIDYELRGRLLLCSSIALISAVILFSPLFAFAGGVNHEPLGAEAFLAGILPPPGLYVKEYLNYYTADKLKNESGRTLDVARDGAELDKLEVNAPPPDSFTSPP